MRRTDNVILEFIEKEVKRLEEECPTLSGFGTIENLAKRDELTKIRDFILQLKEGDK